MISRLLPLLLALQFVAPGELVLCERAGGLGIEAGIGGRCLDAHVENYCCQGDDSSQPALSAAEHGPCHDVALAYAQSRSGPGLEAPAIAAAGCPLITNLRLCFRPGITLPGASSLPPALLPAYSGGSSPLPLRI